MFLSKVIFYVTWTLTKIHEFFRQNERSSALRRLNINKVSRIFSLDFLGAVAIFTIL